MKGLEGTGSSAVIGALERVTMLGSDWWLRILAKAPAIVGMTGAPHTGMSDGSDRGNVAESGFELVKTVLQAHPF
jgi:hypothetical protein